MSINLNKEPENYKKPAFSIEGEIKADNLNIAIIVAKFNSYITKKLLTGALKCLKEYGLDEKEIPVYWVPGAFEIPLTAQKIAHLHKYDAIICLGAVIRGETAHFEYVSGECAKGIAKVSLQENLPLIFGILTTENTDQALARTKDDKTNKGYEAALTALEMADLLDKIK